MKAYNFEIYTVNEETKETGWDIVFRTVFTEDNETLKDAKLKLKKTPLYDCIILFNWCINVDMANLTVSQLFAIERGYSDNWGN